MSRPRKVPLGVEKQSITITLWGDALSVYQKCGTDGVRAVLVRAVEHERRSRSANRATKYLRKETSDEVREILDRVADVVQNELAGVEEPDYSDILSDI